MIILDTNIFIYIANGAVSKEMIEKYDIAYSVASKIEALGYADISVQENSKLTQLFSMSIGLDISQAIANTAIRLKQEKRMTLGDAIIAATALVYDCSLWTANIDDFKHIQGLKLHNPLEG